MAQSNANPPISLALKIFTTVEFIVLASVCTILFFFPDVGKPVWAWEISPFNIRFTGAIYFASAVAVGSMLFVGRWAPARMILPMLFTFTTLVLITSLLQLPMFFFDRPATWAWFLLYITLPVDALIHIYLYRKLKPADAKLTSAFFSTMALVVGSVLVVYGLGLLVVPAALTTFWPWPIDPFHAGLYSAIFTTAGVGLLVIRKQAARIEFISLGLTLATIGAFAIWGLALANVVKPIVVWSAVTTWLWLGLFAALFAIGLLLILTARQAVKA